MKIFNAYVLNDVQVNYIRNVVCGKRKSLGTLGAKYWQRDRAKKKQGTKVLLYIDAIEVH